MQEQAKRRAQLYQAIRQWMAEEEILEVSTPILLRDTLPERHITPVTVSFMNDQKKTYHGKLRVSPESSHKKLLAAGYERIYELGTVFRSDEAFHSPLHNTEFTLLEWYRRHASLDKISTDLKRLLAQCAQKIFTSKDFFYRGQKLSLQEDAWETLSITEAFARYMGVRLDSITKWTELPQLFAKRKYFVQSAAMPVWEDFSPEEAFHFALVSIIEPQLPRDHGIILKAYPSFAASCSRLHDTDPRYAQRFEAYLGGIEIANAFDELCDPVLQRSRMEEALKANRVTESIDEDLLKALPSIEQASGIALGIDRLLMILSDCTELAEVIFFPTAQAFKS